MSWLIAKKSKTIAKSTSKMNKKQKKALGRIIISSILVVALTFIKPTGFLGLALYLIPYLIVGYETLRKAIKGIMNRQPLDECLLMSIATIGAFLMAILKTNDFVEGVAVMLFYQVGEFFESYAVGKSRRNISELMDIRPDYANLENDGKITAVDPDEVAIGSIIVVNPGEKVPIDGVIIEGESAIDTAALTGESVPRTIRVSDEIYSGSINLSGIIKIRTTKEFGESTASRILDLVENASSRKSKSEDFIAKFARIYTPAVVYSAIALAIVPPVISYLLKGNAEVLTWCYRALTFLVISCPCALVISIPLSFFAGLGGASKESVLIKGSNYLEALAKTDIVVFDKTGTLTKGVFAVTKIKSEHLSPQELLKYAAIAESASSHPIAKSLKEAYGKQIDTSLLVGLEERAGKGIVAMVDNREVAVGNAKLLDSLDIAYERCDEAGTLIYLAIDRKYEGYIVISDIIKDSSKKAIAKLKDNGVRKCIMLTGDNEAVAKNVANELRLDGYYAELLPADKVDRLEEIIAKKNDNNTLAFVGDGMNDAPVLARADIGIAMGAIGSDAAIEAADVVLMDDDPMKISRAISIARKCLLIVYENIIFAIGVKLLCLLLGALGIANMWTAIFADVGVMIIAVLNAIRALNTKRL